jgi:hypothetical protein
MEKYKKPNYYRLLHPENFLVHRKYPENPSPRPLSMAEMDKIAPPIEDPCMIEERAKNVPVDVLEELESLEKKILGEFYSIIDKVNHGIPLKGKCDFCIDHDVIIKDDAEK